MWRNLRKILDAAGVVCDHNYIFSTREDESGAQTRVLVCTKCMSVHPIAKEFTQPSGVYARIESCTLSVNHWREQEQQYADTISTIQKYLGHI